MIVQVQGDIIQQGPDYLVLNMSGFGVKVFVPAALARQSAAGERALLYTHFVVREDGWALYGFESEQERDYYILLLGVNGVGPRSALQVLSSLNVDAIYRAVDRRDPRSFCACTWHW